MSRTSQVCRGCTVLVVLSLALLSILAMREVLFAAEVSCRFKAESETTEIEILVNGKKYWTGTIEKLQTQTISIPEGPFTVISKVYNQNLKTKEDVRTETHTQQCIEQASGLSVPLFSEPRKH
jgi:hypothetical protein